MTCLIAYLIKHNTVLKSRLYWSGTFVSAWRLTFVICLSQVARLAAVSSGLPFACGTVYAATEKESKSQVVKPSQVGILLFVSP